MINRKFIYLALVAIVGMAFSSCSMLDKDTSYSLSDLQGKWLEDGTEHYVCFTTESAADLRSGYLWGYEWGGFGDDVTESDVLADKYGNGWFMYQLSKNELLEINKMNQGWGDIPQVYTVTLLTSTKMTYNKKGYPKEKQNFTKQLK